MARKLTADDFWRKVDKGPACWTWIGPLSSQGRPTGLYEGVREFAYRIALRLLRDQHLEEDTQLRRTCSEPLCVNPAHYKAVPRASAFAIEWAALRQQGWTHQQIAEQAGRSRETVTRILGELA